MLLVATIARCRFLLAFTLFFLILASTWAQEKQQIRDDSLTKLLSPEIRSKYYYINNFSNGRAAFHGKDCEWGYLDENLQEIIPSAFDAANDFNADGIAKVYLKRGQAFIDRSGNFLSPIAGSAEKIPCNNRIIIQTSDAEATALYDKLNQKLLTDFKYNEIISVSEELFIYRIGIRYGLLNGTGKEITDPLYYEIEKNNSAIVSNRKARRAYYAPYEPLPADSPHYLTMKRKNGYGVIDTLGNELLPPQYLFTRVLDDIPVFAVQDPKTERWGLVNDKNEMILPFRYSQTSINLIAYNQDIICILEEENFVTYNHLGQRLHVFDEGAETYTLGDVIVLIYNDNRYIIGKSGKIESDAYTDIEPYNDSLLVVRTEDKYGICDNSGKIILPTIYSSIAVGKLDNSLAWQDKGVQVLDRKGELLLADYYQDADWENDSILRLTTALETSFFDCKNRQWLWKGKGVEIRFLKTYGFVAASSDKGWDLYSVSDNSKHFACDSFFVIYTKYGNNTYGESQLCLKKGTEYQLFDNTAALMASLPHPPIEAVNIKKEIYYIVRKDTNVYNLIAKSDGKQVFENDYMQISYLNNDFFQLEAADYLYGIGNCRGKIIVPLKYTYFTYTNNLFLVRTGSGAENIAFNWEGEEVSLPKGYLSMENSRYGLVEVRENGKMGCVNAKGEIIVPIEYEYVYIGEGGVIEATRGLFTDSFDISGQWIPCLRRKANR